MSLSQRWTVLKIEEVEKWPGSRQTAVILTCSLPGVLSVPFSKFGSTYNLNYTSRVLIDETYVMHPDIRPPYSFLISSLPTCLWIHISFIFSFKMTFSSMMHVVCNRAGLSICLCTVGCGVGQEGCMYFVTFRVIYSSCTYVTKLTNHGHVFCTIVQWSDRQQNMG